MIDINELRTALARHGTSVLNEDEILEERDVLRDRLALESQENGALRDSVDRACEERDALQAKIEAMEQQEPVGKFIQHPSNGIWEQDGYGDNPDARPLYALPGAKGEEK